MPCSLRSPKLFELRVQWVGGPPHASMWLAAHPLDVTGLGFSRGASPLRPGVFRSVHLEGNSRRQSRQSGAGQCQSVSEFPGVPPAHRLAESFACSGAEATTRMLSPGPSRPVGGRPATCLHVEGRPPIGREARRASASVASRAWAEWGGALTRLARSAASAPSACSAFMAFCLNLPGCWDGSRRWLRISGGRRGSRCFRHYDRPTPAAAFRFFLGRYGRGLGALLLVGVLVQQGGDVARGDRPVDLVVDHDHGGQAAGAEAAG